MKKIITILLLTAFITPQISFAENIKDVTVTCSPPSPLVMTQVFCRASGISNMEKLLIEWDIEDIKQLSGYGYRNFDFRTKATKYVYEVGVTIYTADGSRHYGHASVTTRGIGDKAENHRFSLVPGKAGDKIRIEVSPPYPKAFQRITLSVLANAGPSGNESLYRTQLGDAKAVEWWSYDISNATSSTVGPTLSFRLGAGTEPVPIKVVVPELGTVTTQLKPQPYGFTPQYDNAARAALCVARAADMMVQNLDRADDEFDRFEEQINEMIADLDDDINHLMTFYTSLTRDIAHDAETMAQINSLYSGMCPTPVMGCARASLRLVAFGLKTAVRVYTNGHIAQTQARINKAITNITTFKERALKLIEEKMRILDGMAKQLERQKANCERAFKKVNTHGL